MADSVNDEILTVELEPDPRPRCDHQAGPHRCQRHEGHDGDHCEWTWRADTGIITHSWSPNWVGRVGFTGYVGPEDAG